MDLTQSQLSEFGEFAQRIADSCRQLILKLWDEGSFGESLKEDNTPVSQVDLQAEALARKMILEKYPSHGIIGEELDDANPESEFQWTLDPIDGTQNLINLIPTFGTLIGLRYRGRAIVGVIDHPVLNMRICGVFGGGAFHDGTRITLPDVLSDVLSPNHVIATNSPAVFGDSLDAKTLFSDILSFHPQSRIYYDCYSQSLAILGGLAVVVEPNLKIWDISPLECILAELSASCVKFNERGQDANLVTNAIFGKPKAVELMCSHLGIKFKS